MSYWLRSACLAGPVLAFAGLLLSCDGGNGGGPSVTSLFFTVRGYGDCDHVEVHVDLDAAGAVLARHSDDSLDCALSAALAGDGCTAEFAQSGDGEALDVRIRDCDVPDLAGLFECGFTQGDIEILESATTAECRCADEPVCELNSPCATDPFICIKSDPDPATCNDCTGCEDPHCAHTADCGFGQSTVTCPTSSTTSTTATTTSTSSTLISEPNCVVTFRVPQAGLTIGSLQWTTSYHAAPGDFLGEGGNVECASLIEGSLAAFNDDDSQRSLDSGVISLDGFATPANVVECSFAATSVPQASQFETSGVEAAAPDLVLIEPAPQVVVGDINCESPATTVIDGTTTTVSGDTTTTVIGVTTTVPPHTDYSVLFKLDSASAGVGALQWTVDYSAAPGGFDGSGASVSCTNQVSGALFAPNDVDATSKLTLGLIALSPFNAPTNLVQCVFAAPVGGDAPAPEDFVITIDDATDTDGAPITVSIVSSVTAAP